AKEAPISSAGYYLVAGVWLALVLIPWCACMGATIPLAMFAIRSDCRNERRRSFSFLYLANVLGAVAGSVIPLILIAMSGFRGALHLGTFLNATIATSALLLAFATPAHSESSAPELVATGEARPGEGSTLALLFTTGLVTMGMEVIWIRLFTPYIGSLVYSFALILGTYLIATFAGSEAYRFWSRRRDRESRLAWLSLVLLGL